MRRLAVLATVAAALAAPALAHAAPPIQRPNPVTYPVTLDYTNPLPGPSGGPATLSALGQGIIVASADDREYLAYATIGDLGGFLPARVGSIALSSGGHNVLLPGRHQAQIPLFSETAGGRISSFTFSGTNPLAGNQPPDNGNQPVPGLNGPPPPTPPPTGGNTVPPANQGFGGRPGGTTTTGTTATGTTTTTGGGTTTREKPPTTTTTASATTTTTTTTGTTTTTATTTTTGGGSGGGGGGGSGPVGCSGGSCDAGSCGVAGIEVDSDAAGCTIALPNGVPGDSISETWTITNTTGAPYMLSIKADATPSNHLLSDLQMGVWDATGTPPVTLPPLTSWLSGYSDLTTLSPGQTVQYDVELYLPTTAGNADQGKTVSITFHWHAQA